MLDDCLINCILVLFPLLIYLFYTFYTNIVENRKSNIFFSLSLMTSLFLCLKYGNVIADDKVLLFCNIPVIIAYVKKKSIIAIFLSAFIILYCYYIINYDATILLIKYLVFAITYYYLEKNKKDNSKFIDIIVVVQAFFISFEYFYKVNDHTNFDVLMELLIIVFIFYLTSFLAIYLFRKADVIANLYKTIKELEQEKQIKDSIFKITHEIKNPIAVCMGYLDMFDIENKEKSIKYINIIKEEMNRSLNIMNDLLSIRKIKIQCDVMDISLLLEEICSSVKLLAKKKEILFEYNNNDEIYIDGDYDRLKQVFINIIKNSIEAIDNKGKIFVSTNIINKEVIIEIKDDGIGMTEETLEKITTLFYTTKQDGNGLGMALSNEIIKAHHGAIKYYSKYNKGTKVVITLPLQA